MIDFDEISINNIYDKGYKFTRLSKGNIQQTRLVRIKLKDFELNSENRRILKKNEGLILNTELLPLKDYKWQIAKIAKDFYSTKFGDDTFSANKTKELLTNTAKSNMNFLLKFNSDQEKEISDGYCICYKSAEIIHYSYPFYDLSLDKTSFGLGMMTKAIIWAKKNNLKYIYLGGGNSKKDMYKLQFNELEWWDGKNWNTNIKELKQEIENL